MDVQQGKFYVYFIDKKNPQRLSDCVGVSAQANGARKIPL